MSRRPGFDLLLVLCGLGFLVGAIAGSDTGSVYLCVDAQGHQLTSDRPIPECVDREQRVLNPSGTLKQTLGPSLTAQERAKQEAKDKQALDEQNRQVEEKRRERALLMRFPNRAAHDAERADALAHVSAASQAIAARLVELGKQRKTLDEQMEFYKKDPSKAPAYLQRQIEDNTQGSEVQKRLLTDQDEEVRRTNQRFDEELERLRPLWATAGMHP